MSEYAVIRDSVLVETSNSAGNFVNSCFVVAVDSEGDSGNSWFGVAVDSEGNSVNSWFVATLDSIFVGWLGCVVTVDIGMLVIFLPVKGLLVGETLVGELVVSKKVLFSVKILVISLSNSFTLLSVAL